MPHQTSHRRWPAYQVLLATALLSSAAASARDNGRSVSLAADQIAEYHLTCNPDDFALIYRHPREDRYITVSLAHGDRTWSGLRLRIRGDTSRDFPKKSLKIVFPEQPFVDGSEKLNFNAEYLDLSYMRAVLVSRLMRDSGQPSFLAEHARLFLNGEFFGLYVRVENMDGQFLARNGFSADGNLYKAALDGASLSTSDDVDFHWEKKTNSKTGREDLENLIFLINNVPDAEYEHFARVELDYDNMVNIIALNMLVANGSTYYHNYHLYRDTAGGGKWLMFPWDTDKTLSAHGLDLEYHRSSLPSLRDNPFLERALLDEAIFTDVRGRVDELRLTTFDREYVYPIIDSLEALLVSSVAMDSTDRVVDLERWRAQIREEKAFVAKRPERLQSQFDDWPRPFRTLPMQWVEGRPWLAWEPAADPAGGAVTYTLKYSRNASFPDESTLIWEAISDTTHALPRSLSAGTYLWNVKAVNTSGSIDGFDSRSAFAIGGGPPREPDKDESRIVINELNYNSDVEFDSGDWIELHNLESRSADLSGWFVKDDLDDHVFFLPYRTTVTAGGYLVLCGDRDRFRASFPTADCVGNLGFGLSRSGEAVRLYDIGGSPVDSLRYSNRAPWPAEPDGTGPTLELLDPALDNESPLNWEASMGFGTPGQPNGFGGPLAPSPLENYPNPFNQSTTIAFLLREAARCHLEVFDLRGATVVTLADDGLLAGSHYVTWDGLDGRGRRVASGVYIVRLHPERQPPRNLKIVLLR